jgi:hypothetical protein
MMTPPPKKRDIHNAGKMVWGYRKLYHHFFCRGIQPVLCNSFQKSGTHLLVGVVESLPQFHHYGRKAYWHYLTRARVDSKKIPQTSQVINTLSQCLHGEIFRGHIAANTELQDFFAHHRFKHLFIFRDLRDVVVSHFFGMKKRKAIDTWPSRYFYALQSDEERLEFLIKGWPNDLRLQGFPREVDYPNIGERFRENLPWLTDPNCLAIRFEDLVSPETRDHTHTRIAEYLLPDIKNGDIRDVVGKMHEGHNAKKSHTFRKGTPGDWRNNFTKRHIALFKELAGQMLIDLGYEHDLEW